MGLVVFVFFSVLYNVDIGQALLPMLVILLLTTFGFAAVGTLFSAVSVGLKTRDVLLAILLFPVMVPVILAAAKSSGAVLDGRGLADALQLAGLAGSL